MPQYSVQQPTTGNTPQEIEVSFVEFIKHGPCIAIELHVPDVVTQQLQQLGNALPGPITGKGLIDSGASISGIDEGHAHALGLKPMTQAQISTPSGTVTQNVYAIKIEFPGAPLPIVPFLAVTGSTLKNQGIDLLLGRDYLSDKVLIYNGPMRLYTICF